MQAYTQRQVLDKKRMILAAAIIAVVGCISLSTSVSGASVRLESSTSLENVGIGDMVPIDVLLDTEGASINVVDGSVMLESAKSDVEMRELSVASAGFSLWTRKPSWSKETQLITFVGGEPGGVSGSGKLLFRMFIIPQSKGQITVVPHITAFANDGKGTEIPVARSVMSFMVGEKTTTTTTDQWRNIVASDNTPPIIISAEIGQDPSLHEGQLFLVIRAEDAETGIDRIEIKEGDRDPIRSGSEYVLQDQDQSTKIIIAVFDKAGNVQLLEISPLQKSMRLFIVVGTLIALIGITSVILIRRKKKVT